MRIRRFLRAVAACAVCAAGSAWAGDTSAKVPGLGGVTVKWNDLRFRQELVDQLRPGLTWRIGVNGATRLGVTGMALVGEGGILLPGEATLNLRYWSAEKWELVAFEENQWQWAPEVRHLAVVPCEVWKERDAKRHAEKLTLSLRAVTGKTRTGRPADAAVTGEGGRPRPEMTPPVEWSKEARAELDAAPWVELEMRFGDLVGVVPFEAAAVGRAEGRRGAERAPYTLLWPRFRSVHAKTELVESGTEVAFGVLREGKDVPVDWLLIVSGGEVPELEMRRVGRDGGSRRIEGRRVEVKSDRRETGWAVDGASIRLELRGADYAFPL